MHISAKNKLGLDELLKEIMNLVNEERKWIDTLYPYDQASAISLIHQYGQVITEEYEEDGIRIKAYVPKRFLEKK